MISKFKTGNSWYKTGRVIYAVDLCEYFAESSKVKAYLIL